MTFNRVTSPALMWAAPRCGAKTRSGGACGAPAIHGKKRCRIHGGRSPGAPTGASHGRYTTGLYTRDFIEARRLLKALVGLVGKGQRWLAVGTSTTTH
jgi:hypothetical protein